MAELIIHDDEMVHKRELLLMLMHACDLLGYQAIREQLATATIEIWTMFSLMSWLCATLYIWRDKGLAFFSAQKLVYVYYFDVEEHHTIPLHGVLPLHGRNSNSSTLCTTKGHRSLRPYKNPAHYSSSPQKSQGLKSSSPEIMALY